jgi:hypothetical protein
VLLAFLFFVLAVAVVVVINTTTQLTEQHLAEHQVEAAGAHTHT